MSGNMKKCNSLAFPLAFAVWKYEKVQQSRVPARFCCSEVRKSATVSCSRSLLLFGSTKKCNGLANDDNNDDGNDIDDDNDDDVLDDDGDDDDDDGEAATRKRAPFPIVITLLVTSATRLRRPLCDL